MLLIKKRSIYLLFFSFIILVLNVRCDTQIEEGIYSHCIEKTMENLGLNLNMKTDVNLLKDILRDDMFLDDFVYNNKPLSLELVKEVPLAPMLIRIHNGIVNRHSPVGESLCAALDEDLIPFDQKNDKLIKRVIHHMYLLDKIVRKMADNPDFMIEIREHMLNKRKEAGVSDNLIKSLFDIYRLTGGIFEPVKTKTIDWVMDDFVKFRSKGVISKKDSNSRCRGVIINVMEVVIADSMNRYKDNANAGIALAINPPKELIITGDNLGIEYVVSEEWMEVYQSWMLTFLMGNVPNLHLLYPKMLIPEVIDVDHHEYLFNRVLALGLTIDFVLLAKANNKKDVVMPNAELISKRWGEISFKYAEKYVEEENNVELKGFINLLKAASDDFENKVSDFFKDYILRNQNNEGV